MQWRAVLQWLRHHRGMHALGRYAVRKPIHTVGALIVAGFLVQYYWSDRLPAQATSQGKALTAGETVVSRAAKAQEDLKAQQAEASLVVQLKAKADAQEKTLQELKAGQLKAEQERKRAEDAQTQERQRAQEALTRAVAAVQQGQKHSQARREPSSQPKAAPAARVAPPTPAAVAPLPQGPQSKLAVITFEKEPSPVPQHPSYRTDTPRLMMGCYAEGRVVTGVMASARAGGGLDMLFSVEKAFHCPQWLQGPGVNPRPTEVPIQGCLMLGKGVGDPATSRVQAKLEYMACVMPDKTAFEEPIKGYITDMDATYGVVGEYFRHSSAAEAKAFASAILQEASAALGLARSKLLVTTAGGGTQPFQGVQSGLNKLTDLYIQQMELLQPTLWVQTNTPMRAVLTEGINLPGMPTTMAVSGGER